jgi:hypothetical protein
MTITNYGTLKTAIADWLNRDDMTARIPTLVQLAHTQANRDVKSWRMEKLVTATFDEGLEDIPGDWLRTIRLSAEGGAEIKVVSSADIMRMQAENPGASGNPTHHAMAAGRFQLYPAPGAGFTAQLLYHAKIDALVNDSDTNWLLDDAPDVYLYGALSASAPFLRDDERLALWSSLYGTAVEAINIESEASRFSGPLRLKIR